jgi:hypothetical protein
MLIQQLNRTDPERVQLVVLNVDGTGSISIGQGAAFPFAAGNASIDGISAVNVTQALARGFVGVATQNIAINAYGLVTAWGIVNSVQLSYATTSITITANDILRPGAIAGTFFSGINNSENLSTLSYRYVTAATTVPVDMSGQPNAFVKGIVRAL